MTDAADYVQRQNNKTCSFTASSRGDIHLWCECQQCTCQNPHRHKASEQLFAHTFKVAQSTQQRCQQCTYQHCKAGAVTPSVDSGRAVCTDCIIKNWQNSYDDYTFGTVCPVIHHPAFFCFSKTFQKIHNISPFLMYLP